MERMLDVLLVDDDGDDVFMGGTRIGYADDDMTLFWGCGVASKARDTPLAICLSIRIPTVDFAGGPRRGYGLPLVFVDTCAMRWGENSPRAQSRSA